MQRLFSTFPAGAPGVGLLLLRIVVGLTLVIQGLAYLNDWGNLRFHRLAVIALTLAEGLCILVGILTPITSSLVVLACVGYALSWIPAPTANLFGTKLVVINVITIATAILFLGPGAFSLDAWLFGRREIYISRAQRSRES